ncbi:RDD family protein [Candidatus Hodarchaeum mangrovi]
MVSAVKLIAGIFIFLIGFPIFIGGSAILLVVPVFTDNQGYFMTRNMRISETGVQAIRLDIPLDTVNIGVRIDPSKFVTLKMNAFDSLGDSVFVGLCTMSNAEQFLSTSISYLYITNFEYFDNWDLGGEPSYTIEYSKRPNGTNWQLPNVSFISWLTGGTLGTEFIWKPTYEDVTSGSISLIAMNADFGASNSIDITFSVGARVPIINAIGWILVVFGGLFGLLGIILIWSGIRTKRRHERIRYYQGAPTNIVEAKPRAQTEFMLQCTNCGSLNERDSAFCSQCGEILLSEDQKTVKEAVKDKEAITVYKEPVGNRLIIADFGSRFWAFLIDWVIIGLITSTLSSILFFGFWDFWGNSSISIFPWIFSIGPSSLLLFIYTFLMEYYYGQTLGKMALNLEVVSENTGAKPLIGDLIISSLGRAFFLPIDLILGRIIKDESQIPDLNQRLTQKWSRTVVIRQQKQKEKTPQFISSRF